MKISRLMEQHQKFKSQGLADSWGDGYLMAHNSVFRSVREAAVKLGYQFTSKQNEAYETFPLLQLEEILKTKQFPFSNNVAAFEQMPPSALEILDWQDVDGNLKKNFVFHEACHGVVRSLVQRHRGAISLTQDLNSQRKFALWMLIEESCANTCELLGVIDAEDQIHRIFYEMNSYVCEFENRTNLKNAANEIGREIVIPFMVLAYLHSNFLRPGFSDQVFQKMLEMFAGKPLQAKNAKTLRAIGRIAFNLSERFRLQTTSFHLRLAGIKTPRAELLDFDFLSELKSDQAFHKFLQEFTAILCAVSKSK